VATEEQIRIVMNALTDVQACSQCGTRFRFGDLDCPHCGAELDEYFRHWAEDLLDKLGID
jgi:predicted amidophosphoribosyltransferase